MTRQHVQRMDSQSQMLRLESALALPEGQLSEGSRRTEADSAATPLNGHPVAERLRGAACEASKRLALKRRKGTLRIGPLRLFCQIRRGRLEALRQARDRLVAWLEQPHFRTRPILVGNLSENVDYGVCTHMFDSREAGRSGGDEEVARLERELADLKARLPAHSVPPSMVQKLEELEERLKEAKRRRR